MWVLRSLGTIALSPRLLYRTHLICWTMGSPIFPSNFIEELGEFVKHEET